MRKEGKCEKEGARVTSPVVLTSLCRLFLTSLAFSPIPDTYLKEYLANVPVRRRRPHRRAKRNTSRTRHRRPSSATKPPSSPPPAPVAHEAPPPSPATPIKRRLTSTTSLKSFQMDLIEEGTMATGCLGYLQTCHLSFRLCPFVARHPPPVQAAQAREAASYSRLRINLALTLL